MGRVQVTVNTFPVFIVTFPTIALSKTISLNLSIDLISNLIGAS